MIRSVGDSLTRRFSPHAPERVFDIRIREAHQVVHAAGQFVFTVAVDLHQIPYVAPAD